MKSPHRGADSVGGADGGSAGGKSTMELPALLRLLLFLLVLLARQPMATVDGELNTNSSSYTVPEGVCFRILRSIEGGTAVSPLGEYRIIARPLSLQQPVFSSARPSLFASVPVYRRLHGFQNSTGTYVRSTYYSDARCQIRVSSYGTALGAHCFETLEEDRGVRRPMSFSLSWDTSASLVTQAVFRGTGCAHPHTFPVDWALGDLNTNRSSYRAADGECFRHLCGMSHLSQDAPSYSTLKGFNNRSGVFITRSHFADSVCAVPVYSDVVSARTCINDGLVAQSHKPTVERKQSWFAVWDAERRATSATVFVGDGCVVPASYAVYRSTGGDNRTARRRLQDNEADGELWTIVLPWLVIGGMLCSCVGCYYCLFVLMAREIDSSAEDAVQP